MEISSANRRQRDVFAEQAMQKAQFLDVGEAGGNFIPTHRKTLGTSSVRAARLWLFTSPSFLDAE
jgi:hypothetical protein